MADVALREVAPQMIRQEGAEVIIWSSIWSKRPTAKVRFDVDGGPSGSELRWTLYDVEDYRTLVRKHLPGGRAARDQR